MLKLNTAIRLILALVRLKQKGELGRALQRLEGASFLTLDDLADIPAGQYQRDGGGAWHYRPPAPVVIGNV